MPPRNSPEDRSKDLVKRTARIRRRYKSDVTKKKRFLPGEEYGIVQMVVVLRLAGYSNTQIAKTIGVSRGQVKAYLDTPDGAELLTTLREALPAAALDLLENYTIEAVQAIVDVMRASEDDTVILKAAAEILDRAGLPKASRQERTQTNEQKITVTDDGMLEALRQLPPEKQEEAAAMIE